jgi:methanogenic corrinoid protein MtbC1
VKCEKRLNPSISSTERSLFTIGIVTDITGIPAATLRVWERRYGFPHTARTPGRHRLYSQDEVLQLQWVKLRLDEGLRASQAIQARQRAHRAEAVVAAFHDLIPPREPVNPSASPAGATLTTALLDALMSYNSARAAAILSDARAAYPLESVVLDVVGPAMAAIGDLWCSGEATVPMEHFATNFLRQQLFTWMRESPPTFVVNPVALACAPDELHEGSLLMLATLLRRLRWPVIYLGQTLPVSDLAPMVARVEPAVIVFVAMSETSALALADWPHWLAPPTDGEPPIIAYGGRAFTQNPDLARRVPGAFLGPTLAEGYQRLHRALLDLNALQS